MPKRILLSIFLCLIVASGCEKESTGADSSKTLSAATLRCESRVEPMGIDVGKPRLSWILESEEQGQKQAAYQVLVASDLALLKKNQGDLWDSGRIQSDQTFGVVYGGADLTSETDCFWQVKVWDKDNLATGWSETATWSMGLLKPADWKGQWIGFDLPATEKENIYETVMAKADWIWAEANAGQGAAPGTRFFRKSFELPENRAIKKADCFLTADDSFQFFVNEQKVESGQGWGQMHSISLIDHFRSGQNLFAVQAANAGNGPNPAGLIIAVRIEFEDGGVLVMTTDNQWRATATQSPNWNTAGFDDSSWEAASVSATYLSDQPWGKVAQNAVVLPPVRYLRQAFETTGKTIEKARLYTTALGIYQMFVNGQRVTEDYFSPGWTDYNKRIYYRTYDVTSLIKAGDNAVGVVLADGWYSGYVGYGRQRDHYGKKLRLLSQLNVTYTDGTTDVFATGDDWKASLGPLQYGDFLQGESYDARLEMPGWNGSGFDDAAWQAVTVGSDEVSPQVQSAVAEPVIVFEKVKPISVSEPVSGQYVFNMGQNFAGVVEIAVEGKAGQTIQIRHAERLNPDGTVYTTNLRSAKATDTYICKGGGKEVWQPYFTFHGFQYVEVTGLDAKPKLDMITGLAMSSDIPTTGTFECSDAVVNKIQQNSVWTQRMNFIDVPTDCPQRDERLGWTGDAQVYINTACYQNDVQAFFTKWLVDLDDGQRADGQYPTVAPQIVSGDDGGPAWADAGVICPWTIYKMYGDKQALEVRYEGMKKFTAFTKDRCTDELLPPRNFHCFGDWVNINDDTPKDVIFMAYFGYSTNLMAQIAEVLGKTEDAATYRQLFEDIKASFNKAYVDADGKIKGDSQCVYVLAIQYDLLDADKFKLAADHLVRRIHECNDHLSTGFVGTKDLMLALAKIGRNDVAYKLLHNDTFPSWGFSIKHGATTIWERWNGWTPEKGFETPGMNSFAHYSFGAVCQWIFENIGGIQTDGPAFKHIILKPTPGGKLTWAKVGFNSVRGQIQSDWKLDGKTFTCSVTIPPNTTATVYLPAAAADQVNIAPVGSVASFGDGVAVLELESGVYQLTSTLP